VGLSTEEIELVVMGERSALAGCYAKGNKEFRKLESLEAKLVVASSGAVADATVDAGKSEAAGDCLTELLRKLRFRPHQQTKVEAVVQLPAPAKELGSPEPNPTKGTTTAPLKPLSGNEIRTVVQKHSGNFIKCMEKAQNIPPQIAATLTILTSGQVGDVVVKPPLSDSAAQSCLVRALKKMRFRKHPTKGFEVGIPLRFEAMGK